MGQAIVYCSNCSARLRDADFDARRAFRTDDLFFCLKCYREVVGPEPAAPPKGSTAKLPAVPSTSRSSVTTRIGMVPPPPPAPPSKMPVGILAAAGIGIVILVLAFAMTGGKERSVSTTPGDPPVATPPPAAAAPKPSAREIAAEQALARALRSSGETPKDLAERRALLVEAVAQAAGTPLLPDARRELERVDRKLEELRAAELAKTPAPPPPAPDPPAPVPVAPPPAPKPAASDRSREEAERAAKWETALSPATGRDYAAALAALEKLGGAATDLQLLKSVPSLQQEAMQALNRIPKGQKVALEYRDPAGEIRRAEGLFVDEESGRIDLRTDSGVVEIEAGEILPSSLAELLRSQGSAVDPLAAALFCLLEGDDVGARKLAGDKAAAIPERFWIHARSVARFRDPARELYQDALALAGSFVAAADAVPKYQALLRDHVESPFVRRNKALLSARLQGVARDYLYVAADLKASGTFKSAKSGRGSSCWASDADSEGPKVKDNFVELSYSVLPETAYRCWIYAGGCCQETFEFSVQGSEMKGGKEKEPVEPGSGAALTVKPYLSSLKKTHSGHTGPKQASHWEWVSIALPKYAKPGPQQLRVLTGQKGFAVAFACVTATRNGPPREADLKELEKTRGERPAAAPVPKATVVFACAFDGTDRRLVGELQDKALIGKTLFGACFAGVEGYPIFTVPGQGELRFTYFLKTATPFKVRLRILQGDKTVPYDVPVSPAVEGRPTEVRIPLGDFKPAYTNPGGPAKAGDQVQCLYLIGDDVNCGLRLDALSVVEIRKDAAARPAAERPGKVLFAETFDAGLGKFDGGDLVDGGQRGTKALAIPSKGVGVWKAFSVPAKESVTICFKLKLLVDLDRVQLMTWSEGLKDNGRYFLDGLKKGEWHEIRLKASDLKLGFDRSGASIDVLDNFKLFFTGPADARILVDDFEIRE